MLRFMLLFCVQDCTFSYRYHFVCFQAKLDKNNGTPSRVIHIRNIPNEVTEAEIVHLGIPFGKVTNVLVLKGKNQVMHSKMSFF